MPHPLVAGVKLSDVASACYPKLVSPERVEIPVFSQILASVSIALFLVSIIVLFVNQSLFAPVLGCSYAFRALASWWASKPIGGLVWLCLILCVVLTLLPSS